MIVDELNNRVGRVSSRPFVVFNHYVEISRKHGVLCSTIMSYLEYLDRTDPPSTTTLTGEGDEQVWMKFYKLPLVGLKADLENILRAPMARQKLQRALSNLVAQGLILKNKHGGEPDLYYAVNHKRLEEVVLGG